MHEILAPLIFVLHCDAAATKHLSTVGDLPKEIVIISNLEELQSDCFVLFRLMMEKIRKWYIDPDKGGLGKGFLNERYSLS
jgi:TBC1 domain family protein 5